MKLGYLRHFVLLLTTICFVVLAFGCGGGGGSTAAPPPPPPSGSPFWAIDFNTNQPYQVYSSVVYTGAHCYIYLENGQVVSQSTVSTIAHEFDVNIYPNDRLAFGNEPDVDGDPRIYILLSNFREPGGNSYIGGYFFSLNEHANIPADPVYRYSNHKELFYMNIDVSKGIDPTGTQFFNTLAHEFQHMIHWQQKDNLQGLHDDTWLDEAMSEVARTFCTYGPGLDRLAGFNLNPTHSLTQWDGTINSYFPVYMWAQYYRDRFPSDIFYRMFIIPQSASLQ